ncbi:MAG: PEP-CTERM sorting domain-containing protein [Phycisphaera sp.]|nr:PEP-CTERM sorting domain-containing protein [Phycisphaera sp.]
MARLYPVLFVLFITVSFAHAGDVLVSDYLHTSPIGTAYGNNTINGTSFARNNVTTVGDQQFVAFYEPDTTANDGYDGHVVIARRTISSDAWTLSETNFLSNNITDSHDVISIAVDGDGIMHMSWGMHANQGGGTNYAKSTASVLSPGSSISFTSNLGSTGMTGNETQVTYPEFVKLADGDLLFFYRNGVSGNGDLRLNRYDTATDTWSVVKQPLIDGYVSGVDSETTNAYWNTPTVDSEGKIHLSWLFRSSSSTFQTNHGLYYAVSEDDGVTWKKDDGTPYAGTITQSTSDLVVSIPQNYSYINQTSMTVDQNNQPIVASRWAPGAGSGNDQAQQMLEWFDGTDWHVSQITQFTGGESAGRRPAVMVNEDGQVLVLIAGTSLGNLVLAHSMDREHWDFITLAASGYSLDPTYDLERWQRDGVISMLFQSTGGDAKTLSLFEFDARGYFASLVPEPASLALLGISSLFVFARRRR